MASIRKDTKLDSLTCRRLRTQALVLGVCGWGLAAWSVAVAGPFDRFGTLKGVDFLQFYVAGSFLADGPATALYDWSSFASAVKLVAGNDDLQFVSLYPPQVALLFSPLAKLPYLQALIAWTIVSVTLYALCARAIAASLDLPTEQRQLGLLLAFAAWPFQQLVLHGQIGSLVLAAVTAGWLAFRRARWWWLGVALGSLAFKPQFGTIAMAAMVAAPSWRLLGGIAAGGAAQLALVALLAGPGLVISYLPVAGWILEHPAAFEPKLWQTHGLRGFFTLLLGSGPIALVAYQLAAVGVFVLVGLVWIRQRSPEIRYAAMVIAGLLINPHLYVYDLVVLLVPLALVMRWAMDRSASGARALVWIAYSLYWLPLLAPLAAVTHVQLTAPAMVALLLTLRAAPALPIVHPESAPPSRPAAGVLRPGTAAEAPRS